MAMHIAYKLFLDVLVDVAELREMTNLNVTTLPSAFNAAKADVEE